MTDRPILFSAPMVRGLLDGRKTQTRRILKPQPGPWKYHYGEGGGCQSDWNWSTCWQDIDDGSRQFVLRGNCGFVEDYFQKLPYAPGDRLWVREAHAIDGERVFCRLDHDEATGRGPRVDARWRSSTQMPRWASRLTLIVTDVRVQRLQEISEEDAKAEGVRRPFKILDDDPSTHVDAFGDLWNSIHGPDAWGENPWVVALTFDVIQKNIDEVGK